MARSGETFGKKEVRNKKEKKRKDKEKRRLERKEQGKTSMDDMIAYVDENGMITSTPPDETKKEEIDAESIEIGVPKQGERESLKIRTGVVNNFDASKGFGFITDSRTNESVFLHISDCEGDVRTGSKVEFETEKGLKGLKAINAKVMK